MSEVRPIVIALIGALGGATAAFVGHLLAPEAERRGLLEEARREAYVEWLQTRELEFEARRLEARAEASEPGSAQKKRLVEEARKRLDEYHKKGSDVVSRIAIYGEADVVEAMVESFDETTPQIPTCSYPGWKEEVALYQSMRRSLMPDEEEVNDTILAKLVLKCAIPSE